MLFFSPDIGEALEVDFDAVQHPDDLALLLEKTGDVPCECQHYFLYCGYHLFEVSTLCVTLLSVRLQDISLLVLLCRLFGKNG